MRFTSEQNLPCLDGDDYAAYALYMQCLAQALDDRFTEKNDALNSVRNNYAAIWSNTGGTITSDGGGSFNLSPTGLQSLFWNDPVNPPFTGTGAPGDPVRFQFPGMVSGGLYQVGITTFMNQGVTANSLRHLVGEVYLQTDAGITITTAISSATEESLSGGEGLFGSFQTTLSPIGNPGNPGVPVGFTFSASEDDANSIVIPLRACIAYAVFIGSNTLIGGSA